jgi:predicted PurR-regulated permease PerM
MKFNFDRKYLKICLYAFFTVAALLVLYRILEASDNIWLSVLVGIRFLLELLSPFIASIIIAYILSPAVTGIEMALGKIFRKKNHVKGIKFASLITVYAITVAGIVLALYYVVPGLVRNAGDLLRNLPTYVQKLLDYYKNTILTYPLFASDAVQKAITEQTNHITANLSTTLASTVLGVTTAVRRLLTSIFSGIIGLILSFYLLNEREHIVASFMRLLKARLGDRRSAGMMGFLNAVDRVFGRYISAKLLICVLLFVICLVVFSILHVHYLVLMSALVALSTLVPYIGPFVGAVPPIVISLLDSPQKAIYVGIAILAMHFVDGYFIEPYVFSDQLGLSPFWILLSVILGGGLFGLWGVLLAVPVAAVIKLLISQYIQMRQAKKQKEQEVKSPQ